MILDIDDNPPIFKNTPYKVNVAENQPENTIIFDMIEAYDIDGPLYNKFTFSLAVKQNEEEHFSIDKTNNLDSGHYGTSIMLKKKLDYQISKTHVVTILATGENSAFTTSTELFVNVIDIPDKPPEFSQSPYYVKIDEELPVVSIKLTLAVEFK